MQQNSLHLVGQSLPKGQNPGTRLCFNCSLSKEVTLFKIRGCDDENLKRKGKVHLLITRDPYSPARITIGRHQIMLDQSLLRELAEILTEAADMEE